MKTYLLTFALLSLAFLSKAQDASVERSTTGIQVGFLGVWAHNEARLANNLALRSEVGISTGTLGGGLHKETWVFMTPMFILEPKLYYNLDQRSLKSKDISGNSGNFFSLRTTYFPDWFVISNYDNVNVLNQVYPSFRPGESEEISERISIMKQESDLAINMFSPSQSTLTTRGMPCSTCA